MRGSLQPGQPWDVVVDLFFYREPEETKDEAEEGAAPDAFGGVPEAYGAQGLPAPPGTDLPTALLQLRLSAPPSVYVPLRIGVTGIYRRITPFSVSAQWDLVRWPALIGMFLSKDVHTSAGPVKERRGRASVRHGSAFRRADKPGR